MKYFLSFTRVVSPIRRHTVGTAEATEQFTSLFFYCNFVKNHWRSVINEPKIAKRYW
jgi:hypothetical protein